MCAPSTSTNLFDNNIDLSTKEGISVWKRAMDTDKLLDCITLTVKNGDKFLARMKSKCSEFQLNNFIRIPTTRNRVPANSQGGPWNNFGKYRKFLYNYQELSLDQVTALACYYWGDNDAKCVKLGPLVTAPLYLTALDPELQFAKEKQEYCIRAEMIFQIIKNNIPEKYFELYIVESHHFLFTDNSTGDETGDGVILLKIVLNDIKLSTVIDVNYLED